MVLSVEEASQIAEEAASEFIGRWNRLVSTTNWEKGRIISQWRQRLAEAGADPSTFTDEAWSHCVGNVSPQHVGRLRRVYQRFGEAAAQYPGLYWSHFQAALDWDDAEMYLEGARSSGWSVSQMRGQRAESMGALADTAAVDEPAEEFDADAAAAEESPVTPTLKSSTGEVWDPAGPRDDTAAEDGAADEPALAAGDDDAAFDGGDSTGRGEPVRPLADLPALPADLSDAFERFKLAILQHKVAGWQEVARDDVLTALEALKRLALAPAE